MTDRPPNHVTIDVNGIGPLHFPNDMSDDEIEAAIKSHPGFGAALKDAQDRQKPKDKPRERGAVEKFYNWSLGDKDKGRFPALSEALEVTGYGKEPASVALDHAKNLRKSNPEFFDTLKTTDRIAMAIPASMMGTAATGTRFLPALAGQVPLGAGLAAKEKWEDNGTPEEIKEAAKTGGAWSALGPAVGKIFPSGARSARGDYLSPSNIMTALLGAGGAAAIGHNPWGGAAIAAALKELVRRGRERVLPRLSQQGQTAINAAATAGSGPYANEELNY